MQNDFVVTDHAESVEGYGKASLVEELFLLGVVVNDVFLLVVVES